MIWKQLIQSEISKSLLLMTFLGIISGLFSDIQFTLPGFYTFAVDLREIPLLVSIFYLRKPVYLFGLTIISTLFTPNIADNETGNLVIHIAGLLVMFYAYRKVNKSQWDDISKAVIWGVLIMFVYYFILFIFHSTIIELYQDVHQDISFQDYLLKLIKRSLFETFFTSLIVAVAYMLFMHKENLEKEIRDGREELYEANKKLKERTNELYKANEELKKAQESLVQDERLTSLRIFTAGIAHEINNPLNFINGAMLILRNYENREPVLKSQGAWQQMFEMLQTGYSRIQKIVKGLAYFSYDSEYDVEKKDIHKIMGMALLSLKKSIPKGVNVKFRTNYKLKSLVPVQTESLNSIIVNLVLNAIYATVNSDTKLKLVEIKTFQVDDNAHISVFNTGNNIPPEIIKNIFTPFFTNKNPAEGTGLGLSICYTLVKHHKGEIKVENMPNGVLFTVILPLNKK